MTQTFGQHGPAGTGLFPQPSPCRLINRTGVTLTRGAVVVVDLRLTATEATTFDIGQENSGLANAVAPTANDITGDPRVFAVLDEDSLADNQEGRFVYDGPVRAIIKQGNATAQALEATDVLVVRTDGTLDFDTASGETIVAVPLEISGTSLAQNATELRWVLFAGDQRRGMVA